MENLDIGNASPWGCITVEFQFYCVIQRSETSVGLLHKGGPLLATVGRNRQSFVKSLSASKLAAAIFFALTLLNLGMRESWTYYLYDASEEERLIRAKPFYELSALGVGGRAVLGGSKNG
eukprot:TRINITY_DN2675_c3_g1_i1.p1 TRINITY_DN2675_c3_g1~~TRINITY_DN2675_c3_g1_i1.p1  ORF type:complete len:120 (+),score=7.69 TRINITY_DN2675_c3_g1_i1:850-1209(+)